MDAKEQECDLKGRNLEAVHEMLTSKDTELTLTHDEYSQVIKPKIAEHMSELDAFSISLAEFKIKFLGLHKSTESNAGKYKRWEAGRTNNNERQYSTLEEDYNQGIKLLSESKAKAKDDFQLRDAGLA